MVDFGYYQNNFFGSSSFKIPNLGIDQISHIKS